MIVLYYLVVASYKSFDIGDPGAWLIAWPRRLGRSPVNVSDLLFRQQMRWKPPVEHASQLVITARRLMKGVGVPYYMIRRFRKQILISKL